MYVLLNSLCSTLTTVLCLRDWKFRATFIAESRHAHSVLIQQCVLVPLMNTLSQASVTHCPVSGQKAWLGHHMTRGGTRGGTRESIAMDNRTLRNTIFRVHSKNRFFFRCHGVKKKGKYTSELGLSLLVHHRLMICHFHQLSYETHDHFLLPLCFSSGAWY